LFTAILRALYKLSVTNIYLYIIITSHTYVPRYTPISLADAIRKFLCPTPAFHFIDAASSTFANDAIKANSFFSAEDDALLNENEWIADSVYLNPPSSKRQPSLCAAFVTKFVDQYNRGNYKNGLVLVRSSGTNTRWYLLLQQFPSIPLKTLRFINGKELNGTCSGTSRGDVGGRLLFYVGTLYSPLEFRAHFAKFVNS
jgi:hypothetical protein